MMKIGTAAAAGLVALLISGQPAQAQGTDDTIRLGGDIWAETTTLSYDGISDTLLTRGVRGGFGGGRGFAGGGRGFAAGGRGGFVAGGRGGFVAGRGGFVAAGRVGFVGGRVGYGRGYGYGGYGYGGYGYGGVGYYDGGYGYDPYYSYPYAYPSYYYPCAEEIPISATVLGAGPALYRPAVTIIQAKQPVAIPVQPIPPGTTYQYDGGPMSPVPVPKDNIVPQTVPSGGVLISLPAQQVSTKTNSTFAYPAYGDNTRATNFATNRSAAVPVVTTKKN